MALYVVSLIGIWKAGFSMQFSSLTFGKIPFHPLRKICFQFFFCTVCSIFFLLGISLSKTDLIFRANIISVGVMAEGAFLFGVKNFYCLRGLTVGFFRVFLKVFTNRSAWLLLLGW